MTAYFDKGKKTRAFWPKWNRWCLHDPRLLQLQDLDYWIRMCLRHDIHILQEPVTRFRVRSDGANTSAGKPEVRTRALWEFQKVLGHYRDIDQLDLFREILPELSEPCDRRSRALSLGSSRPVALTPVYSSSDTILSTRRLGRIPGMKV